MKEKILILASGGLDSTVLMYLYKKLGYEVHILYINHSNKNYESEINVLMNTCTKLKIPKEQIHLEHVSFNDSKSGTLIGNDSYNYYVEMRNLVFISMAISVAEANGIEYIGVGLIYNEDCRFADSTRDFLYKMDNLASSTTGASVLAPLINANKQQVVQMAKSLGVTEWFTCFEPSKDGVPCGKCPACNVDFTTPLCDL